MPGAARERLYKPAASFGLNFERHIPETVEAAASAGAQGGQGPVPAGARREKPSSVDRRLWRVGRIRRTDNGRVADLVRQQDPETEPQTGSRAVDDLVVVAESATRSTRGWCQPAR